MEHNSFGYWLRLKRKALDLTREQLAERVGYSAATIRKIEDEERRPSAQIAERLAELFHIPTDELLFYNLRAAIGKPPPPSAWKLPPGSFYFLPGMRRGRHPKLILPLSSSQTSRAAPNFGNVCQRR